MRGIILSLVLALSSFSANVQAETETDFRGNVSLQGRAFLSEPLFPNQEDFNLSVAAQPEWNWQWNDRRDSFTLELFGRWDQNDDERTHGDIRQAAWIHVGDTIEARIGVRRVFWGVTEFQHLVGRRLSELDEFLAAHIAVGEIDLVVQLSKAKNPCLRDDVRLVGMWHDEQWRFYVTNIFAPRFTPQLIYELYAQRWQVEVFFNLIKHVLSLETFMSRTKNGIMIEIYSALIFYLLTRIVIALAAKKTGRSLHEFSFERSQKLIRGFLYAHFHRFLLPSLQAVERIFQRLVDIVAAMGLADNVPKIVDLNQQLA